MELDDDSIHRVKINIWMFSAFHLLLLPAFIPAYSIQLLHTNIYKNRFQTPTAANFGVSCVPRTKQTIRFEFQYNRFMNEKLINVFDESNLAFYTNTNDLHIFILLYYFIAPAVSPSFHIDIDSNGLACIFCEVVELTHC